MRIRLVATLADSTTRSNPRFRAKLRQSSCQSGEPYFLSTRWRRMRLPSALRDCTNRTGLSPRNLTTFLPCQPLGAQIDCVSYSSYQSREWVANACTSEIASRGPPCDVGATSRVAGTTERGAGFDGGVDSGEFGPRSW